MREYKTKVREKQTVELSIDGRTILWTKPKDSVVVMPMLSANGNADQAAVRALFDWIGEGLADEDEQWFEDRLRDPDDDFDVVDLNAIAEIIVEELAKVPSTSQRDSG